MLFRSTTQVETIEHTGTGEEGGWTESILHITITPRTPDDMRVFYQFTDDQNEALDELLENRDLLAALAGDLTISDPDAKALLAALPEDLSPERRAVVETACSLVGKVNYFWGGKSLVLGWDERWGNHSEGHCGRQLHYRDLPALRDGLQWIRRLGILQCDRRRVHHRPRGWSHHAAQLLYGDLLGRGPPWGSGLLPRRRA